MVFDRRDKEIKYSGVDMEEAYQMGVNNFKVILEKYKRDINLAKYPWSFIEEAYRQAKR